MVQNANIAAADSGFGCAIFLRISPIGYFLWAVTIENESDGWNVGHFGDGGVLSFLRKAPCINLTKPGENAGRCVTRFPAANIILRIGGRKRAIAI